MSRALPLAAATLAGLLAVAPAAAPLAAQEGEEPAPADTAAEAAAKDTTEEKGELKPYDEVITAEAVTDSGLFVTHRVEEKLYYEIPRSELGKPDLWVTRIAKARHGSGYGGLKVASRVVRWEYRSGERKVLLRDVSYEIVADSSEAIFHSVQAANFEPVIAAFEVKTFGPDSTPVVDVTELFTTDVPEFSPREMVSANSLDAERSFLEEVRAFPRNLEVSSLMTYRPGKPERPRNPFAGGGDAKSISLVLHHSMVRLPDDPMRPRLADERVGFFQVDQYDYGRSEHRAPERRYVTRWRLECPAGETTPCEPVSPIVFYVGRGTPERWKPYVAQGIEDWREAFRAAGFEEAIVARQAPTVEEDPEWSAEDARYSVVRWTPSTVQNAYGPHVHDPRTGEILEADIQMFHNVMNLLRDWYFVQVGPLDERARDLPLPDSLMGRLIRYVAAHEVGHSLGFPHNMKASSAFPIDSLRSPTFTARHGDEASIMDYGRFNYVAQPGDGASLIPKVGPYDEFATMWGYRPIPEADSPDAEKPTLHEWARRQEENPWLRFGSADGIDPSAQTEDLGDDPVEATRLGLRNLERVVPMMLEATSEEGESYDDLEEMYGRLVVQWRREMGHVVTLVGGVYRTRKHYGQEGVVHTPVPREEQREAMDFLLEHAFRPPEFLIVPDLLRRFEPSGTVERVGESQAMLLRDLLQDERLNRLVEQTAVRSGEGRPYAPEEMLGDLRRGVWSELEGGGGFTVGPYRRELQRAWAREMIEKLDNDNDVGALARGELRDLTDVIGERLRRARDRVTRLHLLDVRERVERALDPWGGGQAPTGGD